MEVLAGFAIIGGSLCGTDITNIEEALDMDSLAPAGFVGSYEEQTSAWWERYGLEYYLIQQGGEYSELVGLSLKTCIEKFFEHSLEDIRGMVHTRMLAAGVELDYELITWQPVMVLHGGI
jgi:hypothetical protein